MRPSFLISTMSHTLRKGEGHKRLVAVPTGGEPIHADSRVEAIATSSKDATRVEAIATSNI